MYKYTLPKKLLKYLKKKDKHHYWRGKYDIPKEHFKTRINGVLFYKHLNFTYYSKKRLNKVPFIGLLLDSIYFDEEEI